jgi:hypothetical protein
MMRLHRLVGSLLFGTIVGCSHRASSPEMDCSLSNVRCVSGAPGSTQEYATIQSCADAAQPGETCLVLDGTYDERVTPPRSGSEGSPITFRGAGKAVLRGFDVRQRSDIDIIGLEMTDAGMSADSIATILLESSSRIRIVENSIHDTSNTYCVRMRAMEPAGASDHVTVRNNVISRCGSLSQTSPGIGIGVFGDENLVEGNDLSHLGDDFTRVTGGDFIVIRNNTFHDNSLDDWSGSGAHIDGMQNYCSANGLATRHLLVEGNRMVDTPSPDTHFVIYQDYEPCGDSEFVVRYNVARNVGSYVQINDVATPNVRLYNNTFSTIGVAFSPMAWATLGFNNASLGGKLINNIFYDTVRNGGYVYDVDESSIPGFVANHNLAYGSACGASCAWAEPITSEPDVVLNQNPMFVSETDLALRAGSPAVDRGGHLTRVAGSDSGAGSSLLVEDAGFFQDGWAGAEPDWIAVGDTANSVQISSIDYAANTILLANPISRSADDPVWLFRISDGSQVLYGSAPDIGALERSSGF